VKMCFWAFRMLHYLSVSQKQWSVRLILQTPKNETCKPKIQHEKATIQLSRCSNCCPLSRTGVLLSLRRHWLTALSTTMCFSSALTEMRRCTEYRIFQFCWHIEIMFANLPPSLRSEMLISVNLATIILNK